VLPCWEGGGVPTDIVAGVGGTITGTASNFTWEPEAPGITYRLANAATGNYASYGPAGGYDPGGDEITVACLCTPRDFFGEGASRFPADNAGTANTSGWRLIAIGSSEEFRWRLPAGNLNIDTSGFSWADDDVLLLVGRYLAPDGTLDAYNLTTGVTTHTTGSAAGALASTDQAMRLFHPTAAEGAAVWEGSLGLLAVWDRDIGRRAADTLAADPFCLVRYGRSARVGVPAAAGDPVLTAESGTFNVTGTAANLEHHRVLDAGAGAFAVTGTAAGLVQDFAVAGEAGSFLVTGTDATLTVSANAVLAADAGAFAVTGTAANLEQHSVLVAASGTFAWTGTQATLIYDSVVEGTPGAFTITGTAATLRQGFTLAAAAGAFAITGTDADLLQDRRLDAAGGTFTVVGTDATLTATGAIELVADGGTFAVTGAAAGLFQGYSLDAEAGAFGVAGTVAGLLYGRLLDAEAGAYAWTGTAATLSVASAITPIPKYTFGPITMYRTLGPQD